MEGISVNHRGDFSLTEKFLNNVLNHSYLNILDSYGKKGVAALYEATPKRTGRTAASWDYEIEHNSRESILRFTNSNIQNGVNVAIIIQYGHGTGRGTFIEGRDYINPALQPIFDEIASGAWEEVNKL